jgi:acyl-CoA dehydrogenase
VPAANLLGDRGGAFAVAQTRLGGGRIHHAMRTVGMARQALEMMLQRAVSRRTQGEQLSRKQLVQEMVAESWLELEQFRLLVLQTAWKIDRYQDYRRVRGDIAAVKIAMPAVLKNIASRALQVHGSLGISDEMPFMHMIVNSYHVGLADGPTEVHKTTLARALLSRAEPSSGLFPAYHIPLLKEEALKKYADVLARHDRA